MVTGDALLAAGVAVGLAVAGGGWRIVSLSSRALARLEAQGERVEAISTIIQSAPLLNGKGDALIRDVQEMRDDLRSHITNSDQTHAALWAAVVKSK